MVETSMSLKAVTRRSARMRCLDFGIVAAAEGGCEVVETPFDWGPEVIDIAILVVCWYGGMGRERRITILLSMTYVLFFKIQS